MEKQCLQILGRDEMVTRGSRWRRRAEDEAAKLERVLDDVRTCQKEGKHIKNPGAYAESLWKFFV